MIFRFSAVLGLSLAVLTLAISGCTQSKSLLCVGSGVAMSADYNFGYLYYSKPCLSAPGEQRAIYYRKKVIDGVAADEEEVPLSDTFSRGSILGVVGPGYAYMTLPDGKLGFTSLDGRTTGEIVLRSGGVVQDYMYPEFIGRGDRGLYYKMRLAGLERVMHVDEHNHAILIEGLDREQLHIPDVYDAPALWIDFDTDNNLPPKRLREAVDGRQLFFGTRLDLLSHAAGHPLSGLLG